MKEQTGMNSNRLMVTGLTGGTGTGKTLAADYLVAKGFARIDADQIGRDLTCDGSPMLNLLESQFGPAGPMGREGHEITRNVDGIIALNRRAMAALVFSDEQRRECFDGIMHAEIKRIIDSQIAEYRNAGGYRGILLDAPLLFEAGVDDRCDITVLITAPLDVRIDRVCSRDDISRAEVLARIDNQMREEDKRELVDYVICNDSTEENLYKKLDDLIADLC